MTNNDISEKIEQIKKEFQELGSHVSQLASLSTERLEEYKNDAMGEVKHVAEDVSREAEKQVKRADEYARNNPWIVIAGVSVVSLLIGALLFHDKSKK